MTTDQTFSIRFGDTIQEVALPAGVEGVLVEPRTASVTGSGEEILRRALQSPIDSPPLCELAKGKKTAAIMVPGQDRVAAAETYLPMLLDELNAGGIPDSGITVYLATGTHAKHTPEQIKRVMGSEASRRVPCREHRCKDSTALRNVGSTSRGNAVRFNTAVIDADVKFLTGRIIPHYFAGFGGGRKALLPGVSAFETIEFNHALTLAPETGVNPETHACRLADNPVHLDMVESARLMPGPKFVLNTILDTEHRIIGAVTGELEASHLTGCEQVRNLFSIPTSRPFDGAIACAGGAPYDCNFMQAIKALFDVRDAVRPGGPMLAVAQCPMGIKPGFLEWAAIEDDAELNRAVRADYNLTGHNSILIRELVRSMRIALWSDLPDDAIKSMGIEPVNSLQAGLDWLGDALPQRSRCAVVPFANVTHAFHQERP